MHQKTERLDGRRVRPLVRATRSQAEVNLLPPYGDPEVDLVGELSTYFVVGALVAECLRRFAD